MWCFVLFAVLPACWIRVAMMMDFRPKNWREWIAGPMSDLAALGQIGLLFYSFSTFCSPIFASIFLQSIVLYQVLDLFLQKKLGIRMRLVFLHKVREVDCLWGSAAHLGVYRWMMLVVFWLSASYVAIQIFPVAWEIRNPWLFFVALSFMGILGLSFLPQTLHPLILEEWNWLVNHWKKQEEQVSVDVVQSFLPANEEYKLMAPRYPLLRITHGFRGKRLFEVPLEKEERPHILFVCLESFRAQGIKACTPHCAIDGLAPYFEHLTREGIFWPHCYTSSIRSYKALVSTLFGIAPQIREELFHRQGAHRMRGLPHLLKERGYKTAYLHGGNLEFDRQRPFLLGQGFDELYGHLELVRSFPQKEARCPWGLHDEYLMRYALDYLETQDRHQKPCFLYLFTVSNHHPWSLPIDYQPVESLQGSPFLQTMRYTDDALKTLIEGLKERGLAKKSLIFLFGDHGQTCGEHGEHALHREMLYEEGIRVPLLFLAEGRISSPKQIEEIAHHRDLLSTVIDILNISTTQHGVGRSLMREQEDFSIRSSKTQGKAVFFHSPFFSHRIGCRQHQWKYVLHKSSGKELLFDLEKDPNEETDLSCVDPHLAKLLKERTEQYHQTMEDLHSKHLFHPDLNDRVICSIDYSGKEEIDNAELERLIGELQPTSLNIDHCTKISDEGLIAIASQCSHLSSFSAKNLLCITDRGLQQLSSFACSLRSVNLAHCLNVGDEGVVEVIRKNPHLEEFVLSGHTELTDKTLQAIGEYSRQLQHFIVPDCRGFSDEGMGMLSQVAKTLRLLHLNCSNLSDQGIEQLLIACEQLQVLHVQRGDHLTDRAFCQLQRNPSLFHLALHHCPQITDRSLEFLEPLFLDHLSLKGCWKIVGQGLRALTHHPLRILQLENCPNLTDEGIEHFSSTRKVLIHNCPQISQKAVDVLRSRGSVVLWDRM